MLNRSASLAMSTSVLKALPGKLDIKRHSPSILYLSFGTVYKNSYYIRCHDCPLMLIMCSAIISTSLPFNVCVSSGSFGETARITYGSIKLSRLLAHYFPGVIVIFTM